MKSPINGRGDDNHAADKASHEALIDVEGEFLVELAMRADAEQIAKFNLAMALETEDLHLDSATMARGVNAVFDNAARGIYLVARAAGTTCACLLITREWSDWRNGEFWWIQSVYVAPEFRRRGIYKSLYRAVQVLSTQHPEVCGFRLYVEKANRRAQRTYEQLGMHQTHYLMYEQLIEGENR